LIEDSAVIKDIAVIVVGQAILPAAAFQAALAVLERIRRLKADGSQDWLPH
jgi:hypothetical protein